MVQEVLATESPSTTYATNQEETESAVHPECMSVGIQAKPSMSNARTQVSPKTLSKCKSQLNNS